MPWLIIAKPADESALTAALGSKLRTAAAWGILAHGGCSFLLSASIAFAAPSPEKRALKEAKSEVIRWYGREPQVPLVRVNADGRITAESSESDNPEDDCRRWAQVGSRWVGVDAWGQRLGPSLLHKREFKTGSRCFEVEFKELKPSSAVNKENVVLHASTGWTSAPSVKWQISPKIRAEHEQFLTTLTSLLVDRKPPAPEAGEEPLPPIHKRTMYFTFESEGTSREFAVSGGKILVVAERLRNGKWIAKYITNKLTESSPGEVPTYEPIAVFDINRDGIPEVVYHHVEERWFWYGDVVLTYQNRTWAEKLGMYGTE